MRLTQVKTHAKHMGPYYLNDIVWWFAFEGIQSQKVELTLKIINQPIYL